MYEWLICGLVTASIVIPPALATAPTQDDRADGTFVIDGDTVALRHVLARKAPAFWDKEKIVTQVLLTAQPVPEEALEDVFALEAAVSAASRAADRVCVLGCFQPRASRVISS
jgi:hypothetical protein